MMISLFFSLALATFAAAADRIPLESAALFGRAGGHPLSNEAAFVQGRQASFVLVGDSTTNNGTTVNSGGWSNGFCASLEDGTFCSNRASNGKTTGTIVTTGFYALALEDIKSEIANNRTVFVTFSFGHNDMKIGPPSSMGANLTAFIAETRSLGAYPVLVTPLSRRTFVNDTDVILDTLGPWANEIARVASSTSTPLVPLHEASLSYQERIGRVPTWIFNRSPTDFTHLNLSGQHLFGRMVADLFQLFALTYYPDLSKTIRNPFIIDPELSLALYTGQQYIYEAEYPPNNGTVVGATSSIASASATSSA